jgi:glycosyltransferase involved in cell wall biosynthesis
MHVAVFYDYLQTIGGGERVALTLAKGLGADLITTEFDPQLPERAGFPGIHTISLGHIILEPPLKQIHSSWRFARARFDDYDFYFLIGNWAHYAGRRHHPNVYYCLTPTRSFYDQRRSMMDRLPAPNRWVARAWSASHAWFERRSVNRCDRIVAISENVRGRVHRYYGQDASVIYPPVSTRRYRFRELGDFWLSVSRMYPEKRIELQLEIFRKLPHERLVLVGGYSAGDLAERYLASLKPPANVTLLGEIPENRLLDLYARCRGFLTTAVDEDFGITPVEAMAAGKCVLATDEGGYRETVIPGKTGFLLPPEADRFAAKIRELDDSTLDSMRAACIIQAQAFDETVFLEKMTALIKGTVRDRPGIPLDYPPQ